MKRFLSLLLCLCLLAGTGWSLAEDEGEYEEEYSDEELDGIGTDDEEVSEQEDEETRALDEVDESQYKVTGKVYEEKTLADFNAKSPALYRGTQLGSKGFGGLYNKKEAVKENRIDSSSSDITEDILYVGLQWMIVRRDNGKIGYVKREYMAKSTIVTLDPVNATVAGDNALVSVDGTDKSIVYIYYSGEDFSFVVFYNGYSGYKPCKKKQYKQIYKPV